MSLFIIENPNNLDIYNFYLIKNIKKVFAIRHFFDLSLLQTYKFSERRI